MSWAWQQSIDPTTKFVLVALSDHANDVDFTCWPSLTHLQNKTGYSRPTIWKSIDKLVELGIMTREGVHSSGATLYMIMVGKHVTLGKVVTQVNTLPKLGNHVNVVGNVGNKLGKDVTPNHKNHHEPSLTISRSTQKKKTVIQTEDLSLAETIFSDIRVMHPEHTEPNLNNWANTIRLIRDCDGRKHSEILSLWRWANKHSFWSKNILSPEKLRKQWDQLSIQKKSNGGSNTTQDIFAGAK